MEEIQLRDEAPEACELRLYKEGPAQGTHTSSPQILQLLQAPPTALSRENHSGPQVLTARQTGQPSDSGDPPSLPPPQEGLQIDPFRQQSQAVGQAVTQESGSPGAGVVDG